MSQSRPARDEPAGRFAAVGRAAANRLRAARGRGVALAAGALLVAGALAGAAFLLFGNDDGRPPLPDTRARAYKDIDACLLTDDKGITAGTTAARVWQGMQDASLKTHARVSYAPVTGKQSVGSARPFLNSLLQRSCDVVLAVGPAEVPAARDAASGHKDVDFVLVGDGGGHTAANVTSVAAGDGLRAAVAGAVEQAVDSRD
ncbi:hypothetical protein ACL02U_25240 [Streptomyces sp. MS06]|uniref:hypothetical protein n=1 Tax=Streptomyces sp. MS06 TaxID=3385974 RepID=UPI00399F1123